MIINFLRWGYSHYLFLLVGVLSLSLFFPYFLEYRHFTFIVIVMNYVISYGIIATPILYFMRILPLSFLSYVIVINHITLYETM